jgi:hypothetical protein
MNKLLKCLLFCMLQHQILYIVFSVFLCDAYLHCNMCVVLTATWCFVLILYDGSCFSGGYWSSFLQRKYQHSV